MLAAKVNRYITEIVDPPVNSTVELPYTPGKGLKPEELRKDWPNTPLTSAGLVESVQQRIEWLAHRLPHGYQTPKQLAHRFVAGGFTRFESEQERDTVLPIAKEIAQKRADRETEKDKDQKQRPPMDMTFSHLASRTDERQEIAETWVMGKYPEAEKFKLPFMNTVAEGLRNNQSLGREKEAQFIEAIRRSMANEGIDAKVRTAPKQ
jgi:hypothetical protein